MNNNGRLQAESFRKDAISSRPIFETCPIHETPYDKDPWADQFREMCRDSPFIFSHGMWHW